MKVTYGGKREKKNPNEAINIKAQASAGKEEVKEAAAGEAKSEEVQNKTSKKKTTAKAEAVTEEAKEANANG